MTYDFSGKVVLITGGTGALGRAVAQAFGTSNATTVVTYIIDEEREDVKAKIKTIAELVKADITKEDQHIRQNRCSSQCSWGLFGRKGCR